MFIRHTCSIAPLSATAASVQMESKPMLEIPIPKRCLDANRRRIRAKTL